MIAFPKTSVGKDLLFKSPATISEEALYQYGLRSRTESKNDAWGRLPRELRPMEWR